MCSYVVDFKWRPFIGSGFRLWGLGFCKLCETLQASDARLLTLKPLRKKKLRRATGFCSRRSLHESICSPFLVLVDSDTTDNARSIMIIFTVTIIYALKDDENQHHLSCQPSQKIQTSLYKFLQFRSTWLSVLQSPSCVLLFCHHCLR